MIFLVLSSHDATIALTLRNTIEDTCNLDLDLLLNASSQISVSTFTVKKKKEQNMINFFLLWIDSASGT